MLDTATISKSPLALGKALGGKVSSVVAGIGIAGQPEMSAPSLSDYTSDEAFKQFKEYNTNTNLRVNEKRMWGDILERTANNLLVGATFALGSVLLTAAGPANAVWVGISALVALTAVSVGVFFTLRQSASREQTDKYMDVSDYSIKRQAGVIAQEIKKALQDDSPQAPAKSAAEKEGDGPSNLLSAFAADRQLQGKQEEVSAGQARVH